MTVVRVDSVDSETGASRPDSSSRFYQGVSSLVAAMLIESISSYEPWPPGHRYHVKSKLVMLFEQHEDDRGFDAARFQDVFDTLLLSMPRKSRLMKPTPEFKAQVKLWRTDAKAQLAAASNGVFI